MYGSLEGGLLDAIQLEMPSEMRIDAGDEGREVFANTVAETIAEYYTTYYLN